METLDIYGSRLKAALADFLSFTAAPERFTASATETRQLRRRNENNERSDTAEQQALEQIKLSTLQHPPDLLPIPLRPDLVIYVQNLPLDLSTAESQKIANIIQAFASDDSE